MAISLDLAGRVVLVTGGQRGVGLGITTQFVAAGATVVTCGRSDVEIPVAGTHHRICDVRSASEVSALIDGVVVEFGRLDVLVNNAGGAPYAMAADASVNFHDKIMQLNLNSPLMLMQAANAVMQQQAEGGAIVNISSVSASRPSPGTAAYGAAKAGIDSLTTSLAVEWGPKVRVNSITVGLVATEQSDLHYGGESGIAAISATIPAGRLALPSEVGNVALFLASDLASYVSGAHVECHGGGEPPVFLHVVQKELS